MGNKALIEIKDLKKQFGDNKVLDGFNLNLFEGENLVVMGKSGSGKSVMIKCLVGLMQPDSGSIIINDQNISELDHHALDELRTHIGFLFQGSALYDSMTVRENLEFPLRMHRKKLSLEKPSEELIIEALENVGLPNTLDLMPSELSGGMQRRIALARAIILKPQLIIYDEPTSGLDPITSREILVLIKKIQKNYKTAAIVITHDINCARDISNRIILLLEGRNYAEGTFEELSASEDPKVQAFFKNVAV